MIYSIAVTVDRVMTEDEEAQVRPGDLDLVFSHAEEGKTRVSAAVEPIFAQSVLARARFLLRAVEAALDTPANLSIAIDSLEGEE